MLRLRLFVLILVLLNQFGEYHILCQDAGELLDAEPFDGLFDDMVGLLGPLHNPIEDGEDLFSDPKHEGWAAAAAVLEDELPPVVYIPPVEPETEKTEGQTSKEEDLKEEWINGGDDDGTMFHSEYIMMNALWVCVVTMVTLGSASFIVMAADKLLRPRIEPDEIIEYSVLINNSKGDEPPNDGEDVSEENQLADEDSTTVRNDDAVGPPLDADNDVVTAGEVLNEDD